MNEVKRTLNEAVTVGELRAMLEDHDEESLVVFICDYGDHCHTQQALPIKVAEQFSSDDFRTSGYSQSGIAMIEEMHESVKDYDEESIPVVAISCNYL
jgi:hypothetical protein